MLQRGEHSPPVDFAAAAARELEEIRVNVKRAASLLQQFRILTEEVTLADLLELGEDGKKLIEEAAYSRAYINPWMEESE